jgi:hypothetical protein
MTPGDPELQTSPAVMGLGCALLRFADRRYSFR